MKVFVFAYDRFDTMTTSRWLAAGGVEHVVLVHTDEAAERFRACGTVAATTPIVVTENPRGLANQRNFALDVLMEQDEWALWLVDDLVRVTELSNHDRATDPLPITMMNQKEYAERFASPVEPWRFLDRADELVARCQSVGARLGGWCNIENALWRGRHWKTNCFVDGRAYVTQRTHLRFDPAVQMIEDYAWSALNIETFGATVVDNWLAPTCVRYGPGGFGSATERMEQKIAECRHLVERFPGLVRYADKAGMPPGSHIQIRAPRRARAGNRPK